MNAPQEAPLTLHVARASSIEQIPLELIKVINPRQRNKKVFARLVENIANIGLKRPVTVARTNAGFDLVCGQGRFEAFKVLGERKIPCVVITASEVDRYLISLVENLARRKHSNRDLLEAINSLHDRGYTTKQISQKTCLDYNYVGGILILLRQGEERLISAVEKGWLPIKIAITVARSDDTVTQAAMLEAYENGLLRGEQLMKVRRLIDNRRAGGKCFKHQKTPVKITTSRQLLNAYQSEVRRQRLMVKKADIGEQRLLFIVTALRRLLSDEYFCSLLKSEGIEDMPQVLADRVKGEI
ncbi:ParB/RepB/Spo0J family partition protein [Pseudomonas putida]|uniref:ParB/RepB/Spo0J family partition protein n=1 Tax=Pseudomonas TaxID=286 RepID=UPI0010753087|nr:plasmid partitioning protein RepB C-terminal domain-containing protein [Pseudomonas putida]MCG3646523.1 ParB N-terminal domain-containing protein [Pseudomonas putida]MDD2076801.1 ParB N-terminal domain-containing protein [Pseudomonas putida]TFW19248.1 chromosome partitioning protein ParB [Pseudomonas putida]HDS1693014.1 ParB N-terminal domain-containing protein [Pseudomonas putida]